MINQYFINVLSRFRELRLKSAIRSDNKQFGGGNRIRTGDPLLARQVLYQLSYTPVYYKP